MRENMMVIGLMLFVLLAVAGRILAECWLKIKSKKAKFGIEVGFFGLYTTGLLLLLYVLYRNVLEAGGGIEEYYISAALSVLAMNFAILFVSVVYWVRRTKRNLSELEKTIIKDM